MVQVLSIGSTWKLFDIQKIDDILSVDLSGYVTLEFILYYLH